jgi:SAM-dependent methyltransferase
METKSFNTLDKYIAKWRLSKVRRFVSKGDVIMDFGCGYQAYFLNHVKYFISKGIGIDTDIPANSTEGNLQLIHQDVGINLPFEDSTFDKIFLLAVYEHISLDKTIPLLLDFKRVLKPGGSIILTIPTPKGKKVLEFMAYKLKIISQVQISDHVKYYNKEDVSIDARKAGLMISYHEYFQFGCNSLQVLKKI